MSRSENSWNTAIATRLVASAMVLAMTACDVGRAMVSDSGDLADYRAYRVAAHDGTRLSRAATYLDAHPKGAWSKEVRAAFDEEEPAYFQRAQTSRRAIRDYLTFLPKGPHAEAALSLLVAFDTDMDAVALKTDARAIRRNEARFDRAREQRRKLGEAIIAGAAALADPRIFDHGIEDAPEALAQVLDGPRGTTWGGRPASRRSDFYFLVPARPEPESRFVEVRVATELAGGRVVRASLEGEDLFLRWLEAERLVALDPEAAGDRAEAAVFALDVFAGVLEEALPKARCDVAPEGDQLLVRRCDGRELVVVMGRSVGGTSGLLVRRVRSSSEDGPTPVHAGIAR